jgi:hypothetical protein
MAIGRISGAMLKSNLERLGTDLAFDTDLLYLDVANDRIGINTSSPTQSLQVDNVTIHSSQIRSTSGPLDLGAPTDLTISGGSNNYVLSTDGSGNLSWVDVSTVSTNVTGMTTTLDTPTDGSLTTDGAYVYWQTSTKVTDAIDDLNEVMENIRNSTFVKSVDFTSNITQGPQGTTVTLTITTVGNANRYTIVWGDGSTTTATSDSTPSHTYNTNVGSPFDVTVTAFNNSGSGTGSTVDKTRTSYITIYGPTPVVTFSAYAAASGGSPITQWDDGATVYFENTTTNTSGATVQYTWAWGDGSSDDVISSDAVAGGVGGGRLAHTFTTSTEQEQSRTVSLTLDSHSTAYPPDIPTSDSNTYKIYDDHTPDVALSSTSGINEESTTGHTVTFTNNTENTVGSYSTYGIQYQYQWGDGTTQTVNAGSNSSGDHGRTITHKYALSSSDQANGIAQDYTGNLRVISSHTSSPFITTDFTVHLEPDVRANLSGTAITVSDKSGDNQYDVYDGTDYNGVNRALVRVTNTSQNADDYVYAWNDGSTNDTVTEDGTSPGSIGGTLDHDFTGVTPGNYTLNFTANGTPDITAQTDSESLTFQVNAIPSAPSGLSSFSITLSDSYQGTSPKLCANFTDNSASNPLSAGDSLTTTTARRYTSGTIDTSTVNNAYDGLAGTLTADINGVDSGNKTFTTALNENGTFTSLVVSGQQDANDSIGSSYPTGFYQTFDAKITQALTSYSVGVNDQRLTHSTTGNTNYVSVVYDDMTNAPTVNVGSATLTENNAGTYRYISGVPYYNSGSPTLTLAGVTIDDLTGQAYRDTSNVFEIASGSNYESTSGAVIGTQYKSYADIDGAVTMLSGSYPIANTGVTSAYAISNQTINITSSSVRALEDIKVRAYNLNGTSSYATVSTPQVAVHTATPNGVTEEDIDVSNSLGDGTYTDNGKRIFDFASATTNTPSFTSSTNFYTNNLFTGNKTVAGTKEATVRWGTLKYDVTDYSSGFLPVGPDRSGDTGTQYFTFAFRRNIVANFDIQITSSSGIAGCWIALPGTGIDSSSGLNGWLECTTQYNGVGLPGSNTGNGGNGSDGCAYTGGDVIPTGSSLSGGYTMTLGTENMANATGNVALVRIALTSGQSITSLGIGVAS